MSLRHFRSRFPVLMAGCLLASLLAVAALVFLPPVGWGTRKALDMDEALVTGSTGADAPQCDASRSLAGREIGVDPTGGPRFGTVQFPGSLPLKDKEVVLTFDDGPHPQRTPEILDALDRYCVKAVFFVLGEMALEHADVLRDIARRGHLIGTHTYSHPYLSRLGRAAQAREVDGGFAAVAHVLGGPVAPIFRVPYLANPHRLLDDLARRNISVWSVDVITDDSWYSAAHLTGRLFARLGRERHGIVLMHDIKKATADGLPGILEKLKEKGYTVPRVTVAATLTPDERLLAAFDGTKSHWPVSLRQASRRSGSALVASRPTGRFEPFRHDGPESPAQ